MSDETTQQDSAAMSPASAGSVAGEPDAWMHVSGGLSLGVFKHVDPRLRHLCVPLYRSPTLADEEKRAIGWAAEMLEVGSLPNSLHRDDARVLRALLERMA